MRNSVIKKNRKVYIFKHQQTSSGGGGGGADLENNKTATIDVSAYTEPVVITPTAGKDGMKKATVTLSNIPSGGITLYCWQTTDISLSNPFIYTNYDKTPEGSAFITTKRVNYIGDRVKIQGNYSIEEFGEKISDTKFTTIVRGSEYATYERYPDGDFIGWGD